MDAKRIESHANIAYSCYTNLNHVAENLVPNHVFTYLESGVMQISDGKRSWKLQKGDCAFYPKNTLAKFTKVPEEGQGEYRSLSIRLDENYLKSLAETHSGSKIEHVEGIVELGKDRLLQLFAQSIIEYITTESHPDPDFLDLKVKEITALLLKKKPGLAGVLFDFSQPGKLPLKDFMQRNYQFNLPQEQFAYLSGRSLAAFKRDFGAIFGKAPGKWLQETRLEEARRLISEKGQKPTDVYIDVGFENLSHFSSVFKKTFGVPPSRYK